MDYNDKGQHLYHSFRKNNAVKMEVKCCHCGYGEIIISDNDLEKPETVALLRDKGII